MYLFHSFWCSLVGFGMCLHLFCFRCLTRALVICGPPSTVNLAAKMPQEKPEFSHGTTWKGTNNYGLAFNCDSHRMKPLGLCVSLLTFLPVNVVNTKPLLEGYTKTS